MSVKYTYSTIEVIITKICANAKKNHTLPFVAQNQQSIPYRAPENPLTHKHFQKNTKKKKHKNGSFPPRKRSDRIDMHATSCTLNNIGDFACSPVVFGVLSLRHIYTFMSGFFQPFVTQAFVGFRSEIGPKPSHRSAEGSTRRALVAQCDALCS